MSNGTIHKSISGYWRTDKCSEQVEEVACSLAARAQASMLSRPSRHMLKKYKHKRIVFRIEATVEDVR